MHVKTVPGVYLCISVEFLIIKRDNSRAGLVQFKNTLSPLDHYRYRCHSLPVTREESLCLHILGDFACQMIHMVVSSDIY